MIEFRLKNTVTKQIKQNLNLLKIGGMGTLNKKMLLQKRNAEASTIQIKTFFSY